MLGLQVNKSKSPALNISLDAQTLRNIQDSFTYK